MANEPSNFNGPINAQDRINSEGYQSGETRAALTAFSAGSQGAAVLTQVTEGVGTTATGVLDTQLSEGFLRSGKFLVYCERVGNDTDRFLDELYYVNGAGLSTPDTKLTLGSPDDPIYNENSGVIEMSFTANEYDVTVSTLMLDVRTD